MAQLSRAGVPLLEALTDLRDSVDSPEFKEIIGSLIEVIESGKSMSQAMEDFPQVFDTLFISLVRAGEASGRLSEVFESLTDTIKWQDELANSTKKLMMTPLIVGTVVLGVTAFLMVYLVPQLIDFIANMGEELPMHTKALIADGFDVMVYCSDDPVYARKLEAEGAVAIMPLGGLIGSGLGIQNPINIRLIVEQAKVPVLVDAGVGTASDATIAMELGCDAVLMNTAISDAKDPIRMAVAMKHAVIAGRQAYLAGRMPKKLYADPSSPLGGLI